MSVLTRSLIIFLSFGVVLILCEEEEDEPEFCITKTGMPGICKVLQECPKAMADAKKNIPFTLCQIFEKNIIACCEASPAGIEKMGTYIPKKDKTRAVQTAPPPTEAYTHATVRSTEYCVTKNGVQGTCMRLRFCPTALDDSKLGIPVTLCRQFELNELVVCCEQEVATTTRTRPKQVTLQDPDSYPELDEPERNTEAY